MVNCYKKFFAILLLFITHYAQAMQLTTGKDYADDWAALRAYEPREGTLPHHIRESLLEQPENHAVDPYRCWYCNNMTPKRYDEKNGKYLLPRYRCELLGKHLNSCKKYSRAKTSFQAMKRLKTVADKTVSTPKSISEITPSSSDTFTSDMTSASLESAGDEVAIEPLPRLEPVSLPSSKGRYARNFKCNFHCR